jgi:hypothetical protein
MAMISSASTTIFTPRFSRDDRGRWMVNVFIKRMRRSVKYEEI